MIGKILIMLVLITKLSAVNYVERYNSLESYQVEILKKAYSVGVIDDIGYTLAAIAWRESEAGKYFINVYSNDCGVFQAHVNSVMSREGVSGAWKANVICQKLIVDIDYAIKNAILEIEYWQRVHGKNNWYKVWGSYHVGYKYDSDRGVEYAKDIRDRIIALRLVSEL